MADVVEVQAVDFSSLVKKVLIFHLQTEASLRNLHCEYFDKS